MSGAAWALFGAAVAAIGGGMGSAMGISFASQVAAGVTAEDPDKYGKMLVLVALPGTQGIYGFITAILVVVFFQMLDPAIGKTIPANVGMQVFFACLPVAFACFVSAAYQGLASAAGASLVARRSEEAGKAIVFPAMVETYAVLALIVTIFLLLTIPKPPSF